MDFFHSYNCEDLKQQSLLHYLFWFVFFLARIQDLLGLGFELTSKSFGSVFVNGSIQPIRVDQLGLFSQNYLNTRKT